MRRIVMLFWTSVLLGQTAQLKNPRTTPADVAEGAKTFRSHCAECHGLKGEGGRGPDLTTATYYHGSSDQELLHTISNGIPGTEMSGIFYSEDRVWQLVAYVRSLNASARNDFKGDPRKGEAVYRATGCNGCHRIAADGGRNGPDLTSIGKVRSASHLRQSIVDPGATVPPRYWVADFTTGGGKNVSGFLMNEDTYTVQLIDGEGQLHSYAKSDLKNYRVAKISKMPSYKSRIKDQDLDNLVAYLSSMRPTGDKK